MNRSLNVVALVGVFLAMFTAIGCSGKNASTLLPLQKDPIAGPASFKDVTPAPIDNADVEKHIDTGMSSKERDVIRNVMLHLPPAARENVIYFERDGSVYANHAGLRREVETGRRADESFSSFVTREGRLIAMPAYLPKPPDELAGSQRPMFMNPSPSAGTGPYRRLYSEGGFVTPMPAQA